MTGYALLTDWQAIPYDPCTEYSPFHHPELFQKQNSSLTPLSTNLFQLKLTQVLEWNLVMVEWLIGILDLKYRSPVKETFSVEAQTLLIYLLLTSILVIILMKQ